METVKNGSNNDQNEDVNKKKSVENLSEEELNQVIFEGGTIGDKPTTLRDSVNFKEKDRGDDGIRTSSPTENPLEGEEEQEDEEDET